MSAHSIQLQKLGDKARDLYLKEQSASKKSHKIFFLFSRWALMLYRKFLEDNVKIRAESLAFLMLFSILPLITGLFYMLTLFTQMGTVQEAISENMDRLLSTFPLDHKTMILEYVLKFKDSYLESISGKSNSLGVFALLILVYIGLQTFNNVDETLNFIWGSESQRPFLEKARNFVVVSIVGPFVLVASLSVPIILKRLPTIKEFLANFPSLFTLINELVPFLLVIFLFLTLYKYVPVRKVAWRSAFIGAGVAAFFLQLSNVLIATYFKYGTNTAYGKAAAIPIIGFWIFLVWVIVILGAQISYLSQNQRFYLNEGSFHPSLFEAECLLLVLKELEMARIANRNPVSFEQLFGITRLDPSRLGRIISFLQEEGYVAQTLEEIDESSSQYVINRSLHDVKAGDLVGKYVLQNRPRAMNNELSTQFETLLSKWAVELNAIPLS